ncbi:c-type cytochrome [Alteromonas sp. 5E99-2]|uniref:di-heme oxidoreductase family protein n=1 Tax=Alteromonas sp. 5E99-2 TaxID=2817683 RepID=UPI001A9868D8|nr:di-heme oxidoredictase family protein [Alteromonas sp. 5E99-2]MBO1254268.1 c-type cytochrome [Alteromonas sp. 5E99-2]
MKRKGVIWACLILCIVACGETKHAPPFDESELKPGGEMTSKRVSKRTFVNAGEGIPSMAELNFWTGFSLFRDPWVTAPSTTKDRDGLGPLFNTRSCISCHLDGARGNAENEGIVLPSALIIRLNPFEDRNLVDPVYGGQFQPRAIPLQHASWGAKLLGEGKLKLSYSEIEGAYADGEKYSLRKPSYELVELNYGELHKGIGISPRFAPVIYGAGLIDAIDESDFIALEDVNDEDNNGISAKYNRVQDAQTGETRIGRFGLKGLHSTLRQQVAGAFKNDIGINNTIFPGDVCTETQVACEKASEFGGQKGPEIPDKLLDLVMDFSRWIGVPPARQLTEGVAQDGRELFFKSGCVNCHTPSFTTSQDYADPYLSGQKIYPYSDFALHDMGEGLADNTLENDANGNEWRTPPLWGLGLQINYRSSATFLHDGRANTLSEAILWHGGEGEQSKQAFINMNKHDRDALVVFLKSI